MESIIDIHFFSSTLLVILVFLSPVTPTSIGVNYGQIADNLPPPEKVVPLVKSMGATRVKLYDADPHVLKAFANTGVEFIVSLGNEYLSDMKDTGKAQDWVKTNVQAYLPGTKITCIAVGNEVLTYNDTSLSNNLLPAMENVYAALVNCNLDKQVSVTTAHSVAILETSYPPSSGAFRGDLVNCVIQVLNFHCKTGSPFLINAYPYFAYQADPKQVPLDFVLFQPNQGIIDPVTNLHYDNMLFAQIDAVHSALASIGYKNVCVQISETGWPSKGDANEVGATPDNARKYNCNLIKLVSQKKGTPLKPNTNLNVYVFALFNENLKAGPTSERNYGLFKPDGSPSYQLGFSGITTSINTNSSSSGSSSPTASGSSTPTSWSPQEGSSSSGYMPITSDSVSWNHSTYV
ncbi:unnamed protein product [Withania somnifera]